MSVVHAGRFVGASVTRVEDHRILTGQGRFVDDELPVGVLHAAFMRSPLAHGRLISIDVDAARALPGVVAVYTDEDLSAHPVIAGAVLGLGKLPGLRNPAFTALATGKVRFVGDPIAIVIAESRHLAEDACSLIDVDYEPLDAIATMEHAFDPSRPRVFDELDDNVLLTTNRTFGDVDAEFGCAAHIVNVTFDQHRHQQVPMECRGGLAEFDPSSGRLTYRTSTQSPHMVRLCVAPALGMAAEDIRVLADDVGGSFGLKTVLFREDIAVCAASRALGRPVKWIEDRGENLTSSGQAREERVELEAAVDGDGVLLAVRMRYVMDHGAYPTDPIPAAMLSGAVMNYFASATRLKAFSFDGTVVASNKASCVSYRGPWAIETFARERLLDVIARRLELDPVEVRRRNYITAEDQPTTSVTGLTLIGVTVAESLERITEVVSFPEFRSRQMLAREHGRFLGIGVAGYIEAAPGYRPSASGRGPIETNHLWVDRQGIVNLVTQQQPHGQSHQTTLAQVAADAVGVPFEQVRVLWGDTAFTPMAIVATGGSRSATMAGGAALRGGRALRERILNAAEAVFEAAASDLEIDNGRIGVRGVPSQSLTLAELVASVAAETLDTRDESWPLSASVSYDGGEGGWSGGTHCCEVEVDVDTGLVHISRYVVAEDCGVLINPAVVDGQVRGGVAQGIGAVLLERSAYDDEGNCVSGTFMDYLLPTSMDVPRIEIHHLQTVLLDPDVNFRGVGEGGMICAPAAITNAIEDALAPLGVDIREQHLPPNRIIELIEAATPIGH